MARLIIFRNNEKIQDLDLQAQNDWVLGRSSSCDIVLEGSPEISRQHLKLYLNGADWTVEVLSRFGVLYQDGSKVPSIHLKHGQKFEVPPFSFVFENEVSGARALPVDAFSNLSGPHSFGSSSSSSHSVAVGSFGAAPADVSDKTSVGQTRIQPYLKVCNEHDEPVQLFSLDGSSWVGGRDATCTLFIDNAKFSRRHFEIRIDEGIYMVRDLGSSNGTLLNGDPLLSQEWVPFRSGDVLTIVDWKIYFELRDPRYEERLMQVSADLRHSMIGHEQMPGDYQSAGGMPSMQGAIGGGRKKPVNWVRILIAIIVVGGLGAYLTGGDDKSSSDAPAASKKTAGVLEKLTPQQQQYVKDTYRLADRLFKEGRYEMARQEVAKIHQLVPVYEESKNLEKLAEVAIQTQLDKQKAEAQERERLEMEEKIQLVVKGCRQKVNSKIDMKTIDDCLGSVMALNPDHPDIQALKAQVDQIVSKRLQDQEKRAEYQGLVRRQKALYDKAVSLKQAGKPLEAIVAYGTVVDSRLPDPENYKVESKREIASIQQKLTKQQNELEAKSNDQHKSGNLKGAIVTLKQAIEINPENETLKGRMNSMLGELKKQMQNLYQEGVLEESVGEVETAKAKWKKIIELSLPEEDYYKKARTKLKKYEAE